MSTASSPASSRTRIFRAIFCSPAPWLAAVCLAQTFCAQIGPVLPPSAHLPHAVTDLVVLRQGPLVTLQWTPPAQTSDGLRWHGSVAYNVCAWPGLQAGTTASVQPPSTGGGRQTAAVTPQVPSPLPRNLHADETPTGAELPPCPRLIRLRGSQIPVTDLGEGTMATLAMYAMNASGQGAGWSNLVPVALTPVASPPHLLTATPSLSGVVLTWQAPADLPAVDEYEVFRQQGTQTPVRLATLPTTTTAYVDDATIWNQPYRYWLRSAAGAGAGLAESQDSNALEVTPEDVFPPPVPTGLQGVADVRGVDLSWNPVTASIFAGYNVYRRVAGGEWQKRNSALLPTPVFHDSDSAPPGSEFAVTAVSDTGHESARSASVGVSPSVGGGGANFVPRPAHLANRHGLVLLQLVVGDQDCNFVQGALGGGCEAAMVAMG